VFRVLIERRGISRKEQPKVPYSRVPLLRRLNNQDTQAQLCHNAIQSKKTSHRGQDGGHLSTSARGEKNKNLTGD